MIMFMSMLMALGFTGVGASMVVRAIAKMLRDSALARRGVVTEGRIVAVKDGYEDEWPVIAFADGRGASHQFRSDLARSQGSTRIGDAVAVRYDPAKLSRAQEVGKRVDRAIQYVFLIAAGVVGTYCGFKMLLSGLGLD